MSKKPGVDELGPLSQPRMKKKKKPEKPIIKKIRDKYTYKATIVRMRTKGLKIIKIVFVLELFLLNTILKIYISSVDKLI